MLSKEMGKRVKGYVQYSGRTLLVKVDTKPKETVIIQTYMPTSAQEDELIEECCDELNEAIKDVKGDSNLIVLGDWNAVVGGVKKGVVGPFGLGEMNDRGDRCSFVWGTS